MVPTKVRLYGEVEFILLRIRRRNSFRSTVDESLIFVLLEDH